MSAAPGLVGQETKFTASSRTTLPTLSKRGALKELNDRRRLRRMRRVVIASADASRDLVQRGGNRYWAIFVTLTYRRDASYSPNDIRGYINGVREWLRRRKLKAHYQWVIELTQAGKPHYHVIFWVPHGLRLPKPDASGMWEKGSSNIKRATKPVGYLVKYVSKGDGGDIPKHARLFGVGAQDESVKLARHRFGLPTWLFERTEGRCARIPRVGWVDKSTGEVHDSPFLFSIGKDDWGFIVVTIALKEGHTC